MLLCNPKHPNHWGSWRRTNGWGGCIGDMPSKRGCQWFPGEIHSSLHKAKDGCMRSRIVHFWDGKWTVLFEDISSCCRVHLEQAITIKMALIAGREGIPQINSFPAGIKDKNGNYDSYARAFLLARKIGKSQFSKKSLS